MNRSDRFQFHARRVEIFTPALQYVTAEWEPAFLRQAREFPFFPLLLREERNEIPFLTGELGQNFKAQTRPPGAEPEPWMMIR